MNAQLIILEGFNIIVSDEELVNKGDLYYDDDLLNVFAAQYKLNNNFSKVIASTYNFPSAIELPSIDYNGLEKEFGIVDVEKLAEDFVSGNGNFKKNINNEIGWIATKNGFIEGFNMSQKLNDKNFSDEDMKHFGLWLGENFNKFKNKSINDIFNESPFNKNPNIFSIEVEMEGIGGEGVNDINDYKPYRKIPKVLNNKIKITKIL